MGFVQHTGGGVSGADHFDMGAINVTAGNHIAVGIGWLSTHTLVSVTDSQGNTYTLYDNPTDHSNGHGAMAVAKVASTGSLVITVTFGNAVSDSAGIAHEYNGRHATTPVNQHTMGNGEGAAVNLDSGAILPSVDNCDIFGFGVIISDTLSVGAGFTDRRSQNFAAATGTSHSEDKTQTTAASVNATFVVGAGGNWVCGVLALAPAPSGPTGPETYVESVPTFPRSMARLRG